MEFCQLVLALQHNPQVDIRHGLPFLFFVLFLFGCTYIIFSMVLVLVWSDLTLEMGGEFCVDCERADETGVS